MMSQSIDDVITSLTEIIEDCWRQNSRLGYFPAMYRKVTVQIKEGIEKGQFEDGERMERLDVVFANRYIEAYRKHRQGHRPTEVWAYTFEMAEKDHPIIVQHLLLGMNAHINLDLGIAAAQVCQEEDLILLQQDFFEVNRILAQLLNEVQSSVNDSSPLFRILDRLGWRADEVICDFSIRHARRSAWSKAQQLHHLPDPELSTKIDEFDRGVTTFAKIICPPTSLSNALFQVISDTETQEPRQIIEELL